MSFSDRLRLDARADDRVDDLQVVARRGVGFRHAGDALAEVVERLQQAAGFDRARGVDRFVDRFAGDEPPREAGRLAHAVSGRERSSGDVLRASRWKNALAAGRASRAVNACGRA